MGLEEKRSRGSEHEESSTAGREIQKFGKKRTSEKDTIYSFNKYLSGVYLGFKLVRSDAPKDRQNSATALSKCIV